MAIRYTLIRDKILSEINCHIYSRSGLVGVAQTALLLCGDTVFEITRSAGTEMLRENSVAADDVFARDFRCLLYTDETQINKQ